MVPALTRETTCPRLPTSIKCEAARACGHAGVQKVSTGCPLRARRRDRDDATPTRRARRSSGSRTGRASIDWRSRRCAGRRRPSSAPVSLKVRGSADGRRQPVRMTWALLARPVRGGRRRRAGNTVAQDRSRDYRGTFTEPRSRRRSRHPQRACPAHARVAMVRRTRRSRYSLVPDVTMPALSMVTRTRPSWSRSARWPPIEDSALR